MGNNEAKDRGVKTLQFMLLVGAQEPRWQQQHRGCWLALPRAITIIRLPMYTNTVVRVYMYVLPIIIITVSQNYTKGVLGRDPKIIPP